MSCNKNNAFLVENLFNELKTESDKRIARLNLGIKDSDSLTWGNISGNIYDLQDLIYFVEMLKEITAQTGIVTIFRLNNKEIDRTLLEIPEGWSTEMPDTLDTDLLYMTQGQKQGGIYKVGQDGNVWGKPIQINYYNVPTLELQELIADLRAQLNAAMATLSEYIDIVDSLNLVTVGEDGAITVTGRDGQVSIWQHQDLGNYLLLGNVYGDIESSPDNINPSYFVISKTGLLQAHNAWVHGTIYATDGWFAGELRAATGSFTGDVTAKSGTIGNWRIEEGVLKPADNSIPTTAIIGKIQADLVDFGDTLIDLETALKSDFTSRLKNLKKELLTNITETSARFTLTTDAITSSVQLLTQKTTTLDLNLKTTLAQYELLQSLIRQTSESIDLTVEQAVATKAKDLVTYEQYQAAINLLSNQLTAKVSQSTYASDKQVIEEKFALIAITPEQINSIVSNSTAVSNLTQRADNLLALITNGDNLLASLGLSASGIQMIGKKLTFKDTSQNVVLECNAAGDGSIAKGAIRWDNEGNVTLSNKITISWEDITDKPDYDGDNLNLPTVSNIETIYFKTNSSKPAKPTKNTTIVDNTSDIGIWSRQIPTISERDEKLYRSNKITYIKTSDETEPLVSFTEPELDSMSEIAQRAKAQLEELFEISDQPTQISSNYIYTGSFGALYAYVLNIQSDPTNPSWQLKLNGSGFLANGNIDWDENGNLTVKAKIEAKSGTIGGWNIAESYIQGTKDDERSTLLTRLYKTGGIELTKVLKSSGATSILDIDPFTGFSILKFVNDNEVQQIALNMDGSGSLANGNLSWTNDGNLTVNGTINATSGSIGGLTIGEHYLTTASVGLSSNFLEVYSGNVDGYALLYLFENDIQFVLQGPVYQNETKVLKGAFGLYQDDDTSPFWYNVFYEDGSGSLAKGAIQWSSEGYGAISNKLTWGVDSVTLTSGNEKGLDYDLTLSDLGLKITKYTAQADASEITLPNGTIIHINPNISRLTSYSKLTDTLLYLMNGDTLESTSLTTNSVHISGTFSSTTLTPTELKFQLGMVGSLPITIGTAGISNGQQTVSWSDFFAKFSE